MVKRTVYGVRSEDSEQPVTLLWCCQSMLLNLLVSCGLWQPMHTAKTQTSLHRHAGWSESLVCVILVLERFNSNNHEIGGYMVVSSWIFFFESQQNLILFWKQCRSRSAKEGSYQSHPNKHIVWQFFFNQLKKLFAAIPSQCLHDHVCPPLPPHARIQKGGGGARGSNIARSRRLKNLIGTKPMLGQHRHASETPFKWRFAGGPMMARL